jgi:hypothetical protein
MPAGEKRASRSAVTKELDTLFRGRFDAPFQAEHQFNKLSMTTMTFSEGATTSAAVERCVHRIWTYIMLS